MTRGTTPAIRYTFSQVDVDDITACYLTITQGSTVIEKTLSQGTVEEDSIVWELSQQETLGLDEKATAEIQLRYKLANGKAGASKITRVQADRILKDGEI